MSLATIAINANYVKAARKHHGAFARAAMTSYQLVIAHDSVETNSDVILRRPLA
jgi:hypothetical protein